MNDLETMKQMFERAGVKFTETIPPPSTLLEVEGGYAGFFTNFTFESGALKSVEAYE